MEQQLSTGVLERLFNEEEITGQIVLQCLGSKLINNKYRLWLSDGITKTSFFVIAAELNRFISDGSLAPYSIFQIKNYLSSKAKNASVPVILIKEIETMIPGAEIGEIIGDPINFVPRERSNAKPTEQNEVRIQPKVPENNIATVPIMSLSPYYGRLVFHFHKWTIRARVAAKSEIKHWNNARGEGKLFSMDLIDESGEIKCTGFKDQVDAFYDLFVEGSIYYITKCQVRPADKRYTTIKHEFELVLNFDSVALKYDGDSAQIPMIQFDFSPINEIETAEANSVFDLLAVVKSIGEVVKINSKASGKELTKRDLLLIDDTNTMVALTLWGAQAEKFGGSDYPVVAIKAVKVTEFNGGKSLTTLSSTIIQINPAIPDTVRLMEWFNDSNRGRDAKLLSSPSVASPSLNCPWLNFRQVRELNIGSSATFNTFRTKAYVNLIKAHNCLYKACPNEGCKKKLMNPINGMYRCVKCEADFPNYVYRIIVQATLIDWTGELSVTFFGQEAEKIIGENAEDLGRLQETLSSDAYNQIFIDCAFKSFFLKIRMKQETFNDATRMKAGVLSVAPVNVEEYSSLLIKELRAILKSKTS